MARQKPSCRFQCGSSDVVVEDAMPLTPVPWGLLMDPRIRSADPDRLTRLEVCYEMKRWLLPPQSEKAPLVLPQPRSRSVNCQS